MKHHNLQVCIELDGLRTRLEGDEIMPVVIEGKPLKGVFSLFKHGDIRPHRQFRAEQLLWVRGLGPRKRKANK